MKRFGIVMVVAMVMLAVGGCYAARRVSLESQSGKPGSALDAWRGLSIAGFVDTLGAYHKFEGYVRYMPGDSLAFDQRSPRVGRLELPRPAEHFILSRASVKSLAVNQLSPGRTFLAVIGTTLIVGVVVIAVAIATKESCPFIYSYDGKDYVFDGEPYGGATMKGLERTDWSELEHLKAVNGEYRLSLTNEVDETQHTNRLTLLVVDHAPGSTVVMDKQGRAHAFRSLEPPSAARDERGRDLLRWLRDTDEAAWYPDLEREAREDSVTDTRNHITLTFPRPRGHDQVYLVSNLATGLWGSHMIRTMLGFRGNRVGEFYAAIDGSALYRQQLVDWNLREELFELIPEIRSGDQWVRQDFIPGAGPFISESRAIPLDLSGATGAQVEIRIHPPIGFWSLNSFHLASDEDSAQVTRLAPRTVVDQKGANVTARLTADDEAYLDFPTRQDHAELVYAVPPAARGLTRSLFAETRGWYEVHLHAAGAPDAAALGRLRNEPGYVVRRALREYAEYRRSGRMAGVAPDSVGAGAQ